MGEDNCLFCGITKGTTPSKFVYEDEQVVAIKDIRPAAPTHLLIIPKKHLATVLELEESDKALVGHIYLVANKLARQDGYADKGFRIVTNCNPGGGQTVYHIHFHLLGGRFMTWPPG